MKQRPVQILLVEPDAELAELLDRCLQGAIWSQVTWVTSASEAMREELTARHDIIIAAMTLPDAEGLALIRELRATNHGPVILLAEHPTTDEAIEAIRLGVTELVIKPFDICDLVEVVRRAAERQLKRRHNRARQRRLRRMVSRIIRERRDLRQRMDLICQDLVHAYRSLAQKVTESGLLAHQSQE